MELYKIVKKFGTSCMIIIDTEDRKVHGIEEGDTIWIKNFEIIKAKKRKK